MDHHASADTHAAVTALRRGEVIGLPTETVYGLAGDAANLAALQRIYALKGRPLDHPVIVHLGDVAQLDQWAREIPAAARTLAARFWPGPLTLILRRNPGVPDQVTGGQDTVGIRIPAHPLA
ncbi:MAG TPA: L-threonylcarbamoyladenylate synthase, partial [Pseudomonadota bacterium]|nr:L-threonylcarbamoyladenylate synthase [Pseudomonadota bacterium]